MGNTRRSGIAVFVVLLVLSVLPAVSAGLPIQVPGDADLVVAAGDQDDPEIASGDTVALAVWSDDRANLTAFSVGETSNDLYGVRISSAGLVLDPVPIAITSAIGSQVNPKAAWNGMDWLVVFETPDTSGNGFYSSALEAVRVSADGVVLDETPIKLAGILGGSYPGDLWDVTGTSNGWTVVGRRSNASDDIVALRVSAGGQLLDAPTTTIVDSLAFQASNLDVEYVAGVHLLTFDDYISLGLYHTFGVRFDDSLELLDLAPVELGLGPGAGLRSNGSEFFLAWNEWQPDLSTVLLGSQVDPSGALLDPGGVELASGKSVLSTAIDITWDGVNWRVVFEFGGAVWTTRVTSAGVVLDPGGVAVPGPTYGSMASNGAGGFHLLWTEFANNDYDVHGATVAADNVAGASSALSVGTRRQLRPDIAVGSNGSMLVYRSQGDSETRVLAQPLDASGVPSTVEPVALDVGPGFGGPGSPTVAWNGSLYLVSWAGAGGVLAQRVQQDGTPLDAAPFLVMPDAFGRTDVAAVGSDFLVTGRQFGSGIQFVLPVAARVGGDGTVLDPAPMILGAFYVGSPAVVELGDRWLVAWHRQFSHDDPVAETLGVFIDPDGSFEPAFQIHAYFSMVGGNSVFEVGLASNGEVAVMVQSQELTSGVETDLLVRVVDAAGVVSDMINLTPWNGNQYAPRVAWDGTHFVVAFQDQRAGSDLFGMRLDASGTPVDPLGFVVSDVAVGESNPTVASGAGTTLFAGSVMADDAANYRVFYDVRDTANQWPVAVITATPASGDVPVTVAFDSAGSIDLDGTIVSYHWDFGDGATSAEAAPNHTYTTSGPHVARLTITDDAGAQTEQIVRLAITAPNLLPVAAGVAVPASGPAPLSVVFYATGSYDPDGSTFNIQWTFSDGGVYFGNPAYHTFTTEGSHFATLEVSDYRGGVGSTVIPVEVGPTNNEAPTADFTYSCEGLTCTYADASSDSDGTIVAWDWEFGDGFVEFVPNPLPHTYAAPGTYSVSLTVTDDVGASTTISKDVTVTDVVPAGDLHVGDLDGSAADGVNGRWTATVTVSVHDDLEAPVEGSTVDGSWSLGGRGTGSCVTDVTGSCSITYTRARPTSDSITFTVDGVSHATLPYVAAENHDPDGDSDGSSITVARAPANQPPIAAFTWTCAGSVCDFDASGSTDDDGTIVSYDWDFGDGAIASGQVVQHTFGADGAYPVVLSVVDDGSAVATVTHAVTIGEVSDEAHVGDLDGSARDRGQRWNATVSILVHDATESPVAGATVDGTWSTGDSASCVTGSAGTCSLTLRRIDAAVATVTFTVVDVLVGGSVYAPGANHDPETDSDGTVISITR